MEHTFVWSSMDESSDREQKYAFVVTGLMMSQPSWTDLERYWNLELTKKSINHFKTSEYRGLRGEFSRFRDSSQYPNPSGRDAAKDIFNNLALLIRSNKHWSIGLSVGLNLRDYRLLRKSSRMRQLFPRNPYRFVYQTALVLQAMIISEFKNSEPIAFLCDEHSKAKELGASYDALKDINPNAARFMGSLSFGSDSQSPALQIADLIAGEYKDYFVRRVKGEIATYSNFMEAMKGHVGILYWDRRRLVQLADANLLVDGKPSLRSSRQAKLFHDLLGHRFTQPPE
jgi:Protein of unknown function (DUF3800)